MKLETSNTVQTGNQGTLNNHWLTTEITRGIREYLQQSENGNITYQNLQDAVKAVLRGQLITINDYIKKRRGFFWQSSG